ncbi:hypothetical protein DFH08DRAFT_1049749 [Mycena albidolilacea]|uniref:Uncharacterized protein n=1 Tax=Mycena albidolilacea TaxID=1033008 RepID=A0AAD7EC54_9AGAR|nr:hypothetical protein DFH08DRAFT_1049749 [Mycena albidolilacea]
MHQKLQPISFIPGAGPVDPNIDGFCSGCTRRDSMRRGPTRNSVAQGVHWLLPVVGVPVVSPSPLDSEESDEETVSDTTNTQPDASILSTISHFPIIYPPHSTTMGPIRSNAVAFGCPDAETLGSQFTSGGVLVSVHSPRDAVLWLETHHDHPIIQSLKSRNVDGPIAVRMSPDESALAVFGSIADVLVPRIARSLADFSGFAVMFRSSVDNPIPSFASPEEDPTGQQPFVSSEQPATRLRGGAGSEAEDFIPTLPKWEGKYHNATVDLKLKLDEEKVYDVTLDSCMKFKTQPLTNSDRTIFRPRPEVVSHVNLKVQLRRGETMLDRSFSNLGFLVHRPRAIVTCDFLDMGFGPPEAKIKRCNQKSTTKTGGGSLGLAGLLPGLNMNAARTRGVSQTMEIADEEPMPRCAMRHDLGKGWDREEAERAGKDFRSYDISWLPARDGEDIAYEMYVEFGLGMYLHKKKQRELPQISSVLRNQVMIWVSDPDLKAKGMGILLLTSTYVPNALTNESFEIHETTSVDLKSSCMSHDTSFSEQPDKPSEAAMSVSIATLKKSKKDQTPGMLGKLLSYLSPKSSTNQPPLPTSLFMNETVSRGWDATNKQWKNVVWPTLDKDFCSVHTSKHAAWKLLRSGVVEPVAAKVTVPPKAAASNAGGD